MTCILPACQRYGKHLFPHVLLRGSQWGCWESQEKTLSLGFLLLHGLPGHLPPCQTEGLPLSPLTPIALPCGGERSPGDGSRLRRGMQNKSLPDGTGATFRSLRSWPSAASSSSPLLQAPLHSRTGWTLLPGRRLEIPPVQHASVLRPCQLGCDFCPSGAGPEALWGPPGYVRAPIAGTHPGLWLPRYEQRWYSSLHPPNTPFFHIQLPGE